MGVEVKNGFIKEVFLVDFGVGIWKTTIEVEVDNFKIQKDLVSKKEEKITIKICF